MATLRPQGTVVIVEGQRSGGTVGAVQKNAWTLDDDDNENNTANGIEKDHDGNKGDAPVKSFSNNTTDEVGPSSSPQKDRPIKKSRPTKKQDARRGKKEGSSSFLCCCRGEATDEEDCNGPEVKTKKGNTNLPQEDTSPSGFTRRVDDETSRRMLQQQMQMIQAPCTSTAPPLIQSKKQQATRTNQNEMISSTLHEATSGPQFQQEDGERDENSSCRPHNVVNASVLDRIGQRPQQGQQK